MAAGDDDIAALFTALAIRAAAAILRFDCRNVATRQKADRSMVTAADEAAEAAILPGLAAELSGVPVVSEESAREAHSGDYVLVDPLDGTAEFLAGRDEYTVNIALVRNGVPVIGVVAAPALGLVWRGAADVAERLRVGADGTLAERTTIRTRTWPKERVATVSRSHYEPASVEFLETLRAGHHARLRIGAEILPPCRRGRRHLSAARADVRVGCGGRPCACFGGGRRDDGAGRRCAPLRTGRRLSRAGLRRLGRCRGGAAGAGLRSTRQVRS